MEKKVIIDQIDKTIKECYSDNQDNAIKEIETLTEMLMVGKSDNSIVILILNKILEAISKKDFVLVGDYINYQLRSAIIDVKSIDQYYDYDSYVPKIDDKMFFLSTETEEPSLCVKKKNDEVVRLNSIISPVNEVSAWIESLKLRKIESVVCLFGIGTGLFAEEILKRITDDSTLIIYEPDKSIMDFCINSGSCSDSSETERRILQRLKKIVEDKRVVLCIEEENASSFEQTLSLKLEYLRLAGLTIAKHNNYDKLYPKECLKYIHEIDYFRRRMMINKGTISIFKEDTIDNTFNNLKICKHMNLCSDLGKILPQNIPVIIVAAGPSLKKNVDVLREAKGHCLIVAVDRVVNFLLEKDIIPDMTIAIDALKPLDCYKDDRSDDIPGIFDIILSREIVNKHKGRVFLFYCRGYVKLLLESIGKSVPFEPSSGGSVATAAFAVMRMLGQKKIILVGQDLAYLDGSSHAGGENDDSENTVRSIVEGINGEDVVTRHDWKNYLEWYERIIKDIKDNDEDVHVIDATEGGAKIHGSEIMTLRKALDCCKNSDGSPIEYDFKKELEKLDCYLDKDECIKLYDMHKKSIEKLKEIRLKADDAIRICNKLIKGIQDEKVTGTYVDKEKKKISKINEMISKSLIFPLLNDYLITDVVDEVTRLRLAEGDIKTVELNGINLMKISFEAISNAADKLYQKAKLYPLEHI